MKLLDVDFVIRVHDEIIRQLGGLNGFAGGGPGGVDSALQRVANHAHYVGLNDVFSIAAFYAEAIARGHVFNDGNKRTAFTCALAYLDLQGIRLKQNLILEEATVRLADGHLSRDEFAWLLSHIAFG